MPRKHPAEHVHVIDVGRVVLTRSEEAELVNNYHLARAALAYPESERRWARMGWAAKAFNQEHPDVHVGRAYKILDRLLA